MGSPAPLAAKLLPLLERQIHELVIDSFERWRENAFHRYSDVTTQVDSWLNMRFHGLPAHPIFRRDYFGTGGSGEATDWPGILAGVHEVRAAARRFLDAEPAPNLDRVIAYDGAVSSLRQTGLPLRFALMSIAAHHFQHVGEIITIRSRLGHVLKDSPDWGRALI